MQSDLKGQRPFPRTKNRHGVWLWGQMTGGEKTTRHLQALSPLNQGALKADTQGLAGWTRHKGTNHLYSGSATSISVGFTFITTASQQMAVESQGGGLSLIPTVWTGASSQLGISFPPLNCFSNTTKGAGRENPKVRLCNQVRTISYSHDLTIAS